MMERRLKIMRPDDPPSALFAEVQRQDQFMRLAGS
jgi:hypothetical protein